MSTPHPLGAPDSTTQGPAAVEALAGLARRVLGSVGDRVSWQLHPRRDDIAASRWFEYEADGEQLTVRGSDATAAASGLHEYLKQVLCRRVCWDTPLPLDIETLPPIALTRGEARTGAVYHLNFCTFSYTAAYWDWARWEREIDWMALHGITLPLAAVGHEAVLYRVYRELGLADEEVRDFLGGPGYLAWQFMGCLDRWAGPMSTAWIEAHEQLGARILRRERALGMTPVLPAFVGHVPPSLAGPGTTERDWWGFPTHLLHPHDERFGQLAARVAAMQQQVFGTSHLYAADPFIETVPPEDDPGYLVDVAAALVGGLRAADPQAVWLMQAWTFDYLDWWTDDRIAELLDGVADDAMIVLDLWGEHSPQWRRFDGFRGTPWLWCALHNFGGRCDLVGDLAGTRNHLESALAAGSPPAGIGLAMEATEQNMAVYELVLDLVWSRIEDLGDWAAAFAAQRYGAELPGAADAWRALVRTAYAAPPARLEPTERPGSVSLRPTAATVLDPDRMRRFVDEACWYDPTALVAAGEALLTAARARPDLLDGPLGHDLVSLAATTSSRASDRLLLDVIEAWHRLDTAIDDSRLDVAGRRFLDGLGDLDQVLSLRPELRLDTWERDAASWAADPADHDLLIDSARRILSIWNRSERAPLTDYSARLWSGVVAGLYRERWRVWLEELAGVRAGGAGIDATVLDARIDTAIDTVVAAFLGGTAPRPRPSTADPLTLIQRILATSASVLRPPSAIRP